MILNGRPLIAAARTPLLPDERSARLPQVARDPFPFLDRAGHASYSHVDLLGIRFSVNEQIRISVFFADVAALVGADEVFSE